MEHPLNRLVAGRMRLVFVPLLVATLLVSFIMSSIGAPLASKAAPSGIVSFELAGSVSQARQMVDSWDQTAKMHAALSLGLDYLYMPLYSTTIALACVWAAGVMRKRKWTRVATWGIVLAWGLWLAAVLDAKENLALIIILFNGPADPWPLLAQACAIGKFGLIILGLLYSALGAVVTVSAKVTKTTQEVLP